MYFLNIIDEQGRFLGYKVSLYRNGQTDTHTYSYLYVRNELKKYYTMGLEKPSELEKKVVRDESKTS